MNLKIESQRIQYMVSERTVVAYMTECKYDLIECAIPMVGDSSIHDHKLFMNSSYSAKAYCDPTDNFSVELGKTIARLKLIAKYRLAAYKHFVSYRNEIVSHLDRVMKVLDDERKFSLSKFESIVNDTGADHSAVDRLKDVM